MVFYWTKQHKCIYLEIHWTIKKPYF